jgi:hypothetical protein
VTKLAEFERRLIIEGLEAIEDMVARKLRRRQQIRGTSRRSGRERTRLTTRWQLPPARRNLSGTAFMSGCISMTSRSWRSRRQPTGHSRAGCRRHG